jgi:hypothetical protein
MLFLWCRRCDDFVSCCGNQLPAGVGCDLSVESFIPNLPDPDYIDKEGDTCTSSSSIYVGDCATRDDDLSIHPVLWTYGVYRTRGAHVN